MPSTKNESHPGHPLGGSSKNLNKCISMCGELGPVLFNKKYYCKRCVIKILGKNSLRGSMIDIIY